VYCRVKAKARKIDVCFVCCRVKAKAQAGTIKTKKVRKKYKERTKEELYGGKNVKVLRTLVIAQT
jgi:hypothetical protein